MILSYITNKGAELITRSIAEGKPIVFTRAAAGSGIVEQTKAAMMARTSLLIPVTVNAIGISSKKMDRNGNLLITVKFDNRYSTSPVTIQELGTFAKLDGDQAEVLFSYTAFGTTPDIVPAQTDVEVYRTYDMSYTFIGAETTEVTIDPSSFWNEATIWSDAGKGGD